MRLALKTNANSLQILEYFFDNFFIFSQWPLIFDIIKFNTCLYRFLLKILKSVGYSSIVFLVRRISQQFNVAVAGLLSAGGECDRVGIRESQVCERDREHARGGWWQALLLLQRRDGGMAIGETRGGRAGARIRRRSRSRPRRLLRAGVLRRWSESRTRVEELQALQLIRRFVVNEVAAFAYE